MNDELTPPATRNSIELLGVSQEKLNDLMSKLKGIDLFVKKMEMEEEGFVPWAGTLSEAIKREKGQEGLVEEDKESTAIIRLIYSCFFTNEIITEEEQGEDVDSGPEDEEVPTRGYLKRQANLIVDAKSRSKRGNRRR